MEFSEDVINVSFIVASVIRKLQVIYSSQFKSSFLIFDIFDGSINMCKEATRPGITNLLLMNRRNFLALAAGASAAAELPLLGWEEDSAIPIIDTHIHLF